MSSDRSSKLSFLDLIQNVRSLKSLMESLYKIESIAFDELRRISKRTFNPSIFDKPCLVFNNYIDTEVKLKNLKLNAIEIQISKITEIDSELKLYINSKAYKELTRIIKYINKCSCMNTNVKKYKDELKKLEGIKELAKDYDKKYKEISTLLATRDELISTQFDSVVSSLKNERYSFEQIIKEFNHSIENTCNQICAVELEKYEAIKNINYEYSQMLEKKPEECLANNLIEILNGLKNIVLAEEQNTKTEKNISSVFYKEEISDDIESSKEKLETFKNNNSKKKSNISSHENVESGEEEENSRSLFAIKMKDLTRKTKEDIPSENLVENETQSKTVKNDPISFKSKFITNESKKLFTKEATNIVSAKAINNSIQCLFNAKSMKKANVCGNFHSNANRLHSNYNENIKKENIRQESVDSDRALKNNENKICSDNIIFGDDISPFNSTNSIFYDGNMFDTKKFDRDLFSTEDLNTTVNITSTTSLEPNKSSPCPSTSDPFDLFSERKISTSSPNELDPFDQSALLNLNKAKKIGISVIPTHTKTNLNINDSNKNDNKYESSKVTINKSPMNNLFELNLKKNREKLLDRSNTISEHTHAQFSNNKMQTPNDFFQTEPFPIDKNIFPDSNSFFSESTKPNKSDISPLSHQLRSDNKIDLKKRENITATETPVNISQHEHHNDFFKKVETVENLPIHNIVNTCTMKITENFVIKQDCTKTSYLLDKNISLEVKKNIFEEFKNLCFENSIDIDIINSVYQFIKTDDSFTSSDPDRISISLDDRCTSVNLFEISTENAPDTFVLPIFGCTLSTNLPIPIQISITRKIINSLNLMIDVKVKTFPGLYRWDNSSELSCSAQLRIFISDSCNGKIQLVKFMPRDCSFCNDSLCLTWYIPKLLFPSKDSSSELSHDFKAVLKFPDAFELTQSTQSSKCYLNFNSGDLSAIDDTIQVNNDALNFTKVRTTMVEYQFTG